MLVLPMPTGESETAVPSSGSVWLSGALGEFSLTGSIIKHTLGILNASGLLLLCVPLVAHVLVELTYRCYLRNSL